MATSFHGFAVKEKIGAGGMSTVYKGAHETLGYPVAIKVLHPGMAGDQSFIARFEREAKAASALRNNNIASVIDFGSENDIYFIVMEFIDGLDTGQIFKDLQDEGAEPKAMPIEITLALLEEVAYGLRDAHERGIIHRDIKPSNILLARSGEVKIADFGLARDTRDMVSLSDKDLTMPGTVVGTPSYMSPEQAAGTELDARSDIFSLGVMAYQLVMGEKPFKGDTPTEVQERIINQDPPRLSRERCPLLTPEIENMVFKMMAKDPGRRYQSMDQVLRAMSDCMESIDSSGSVIKYKRDYLARFAKEPREFSDELRRKGISNHLKRGYHFKKMGLSNIDDALREFTYVLSLDPDNEKARDAITELKHEAEQSGITPAYQGPDGPATEPDVGKTQVMPSAPAPTSRPRDESGTKPEPESGTKAPADDPHATKQRPTPPPSPPRRKPAGPQPPTGKKVAGGLNRTVLYGGIGGVALIVLILAVVFWPRGGDDGAPELPEPTGPATEIAQGGDAAPTQPSGEQPGAGEEATGPADTPAETPAETPTDAQAGQETESAAAPETEPETTEPPVERTAQPPPTGTLAITSTPTGGVVYIKQNPEDDFRRLGTAPLTTDPLEVGTWELRVEKSGHRGQSKVVTVFEDQERSVGFELTPRRPAAPPPPAGPGWFRVVVSPFGDIFLDGHRIASSERVAVIRAEAGQDHTIRIHHGPTVGDIVLTGQRTTAGDTVSLGRQFFDVGSLRVAANYPARLTVDGSELEGQTPLALDRVLVGTRELTALKDNFTVDRLWRFEAGGQRVEIRPIDANATPRRYRVDVESGETLRIKFDLKPVDDQ